MTRALAWRCLGIVIAGLLAIEIAGLMPSWGWLFTAGLFFGAAIGFAAAAPRS